MPMNCRCRAILVVARERANWPILPVGNRATTRVAPAARRTSIVERAGLTAPAALRLELEAERRVPSGFRPAT